MHVRTCVVFRDPLLLMLLLSLLILDLFDAGYLLCSKAVTRGVNKGAKEDFRAAMERESVAVMKALNHFSKYRGGDS